MEGSIEVDQPPEVCYRYWRDFKHLPDFVTHLQSVAVIDDQHSHWMVDAPADTTVEWDAEIIEDFANERISWRSLPGSQIDNAGSVQFDSRDAGHHTEVKVALTYNPPLGPLGDAFSQLFGETPAEQLQDDLSRFKVEIESATGRAGR